MGERASTTTSRPSAARAAASPKTAARGAIIPCVIPSFPDRPRGSLGSSLSMTVDHHRAVLEDPIRVGENHPPGQRVAFEHPLESPVGQNVIDAGSPEFVRPPRVAPVGAFPE